MREIVSQLVERLVLYQIYLLIYDFTQVHLQTGQCVRIFLS